MPFLSADPSISTSKKLIQGTCVLTIAGLITRIMGFFFRIFLCHGFGEENVGLYQLIFPVYTLCLSVSTSGIQTALSHLVAENNALGRSEKSKNYLKLSLLLALALSITELILLQKYSPFIAITLLGDGRCNELLLILSYAIPFAAIHSCICGYYLGMHKTTMPAISQIIEQAGRMLFVLSLFIYFRYTHEFPSIKLAVSGIVAGELCASLFCAHELKQSCSPSCFSRSFDRFYFSGISSLLSLSVPLTANRTAVTLLQSLEAVAIPGCLKLYGMSSGKALCLYGVLTGMAMPCILFPSALTNSIGTVLLPAVSAAKNSNKKQDISKILIHSLGSCFILGMSCCLFFLITGHRLGLLLFHSHTAGNFMMTLAWICPFLYTNTSLTSAINGFGKTTSTLLINSCGLIIRIFGVFFIIPKQGIYGYLVCLLISQLLVFLLSMIVLKNTVTES